MTICSVILFNEYKKRRSITNSVFDERFIIMERQSSKGKMYLESDTMGWLVKGKPYFGKGMLMVKYRTIDSAI